MENEQYLGLTQWMLQYVWVRMCVCKCVLCVYGLARELHGFSAPPHQQTDTKMQNYPPQ